MQLRVLVLLALVLSGSGHAAALPDPTAAGPFVVGYTRTTFTRPSTLDGRERRLDSIVWYPADVEAEPLDQYGHRDAAVHRGKHPVLVYSHGGCAYPEVSTFLTMSLASVGFVVVAPSHAGDTVFDGFDVCDLVELRGPTLTERVDDVTLVLDVFLGEGRARESRFFRRLARRKVGVLGWSSGASTAIVAGRRLAPRIRGVLSLAPDARPERIGTEPVGAPTMVMVGELDYYDPQQTSLDQTYDLLAPPRYAVHLRRTGHFAFSDPCIPLAGGEDCREDALSQDAAHRLVLRFAVPFLLRHVAGARRWSTLLDPGEAVPDAELRAERRRRPSAGDGSPYLGRRAVGLPAEPSEWESE